MVAQPQYLSEEEHAAFQRGDYLHAYDKLGAHLGAQQGQEGVHFSVWAPGAERVSVVGDFNAWNAQRSCLTRHAETGIWQGFVPGVREGQRYRYCLQAAGDTPPFEKSDPYAFGSEVRPETASVVRNLKSYQWHDGAWLKQREEFSINECPMCIYEMHLGSWRHFPEGGTQARAYEKCRADAELPPVSYRELAKTLPAYLSDMGFTHVEFMPVMEHPYDGSWGYQLCGYFAPTSRYGSANDFMGLVDALHCAGIGVILDSVPAHFAIDPHGLHEFDSSPLYEYSDPLRAKHADWGTYVFDYSKLQVQQFLISHYLFWAEKYHIDAFRIDAVASMVYLDYSKAAGEWVPNCHGGRENLEAIAFLQRLNECIYSEVPGVCTIAEESTAWPMVSRPTFAGGLGFGLKWNMGWMHDVLDYFSRDPLFRSHHHHQVTFSFDYAFSENFVLPLSHDEVVHGKDSLVRRMPGHWWERFAGVRTLYGLMYGHPGKKLLFMGNELGTWNEWYYKRCLDWSLLDLPLHKGVWQWVYDLNHYLLSQPALYQLDFEAQGFEWIDKSDGAQNIFSFLRFNRDRTSCVLVVCNFAPVLHEEYVVGAPFAGEWLEVLNSDAECYGGSGEGNQGRAFVEHKPHHSRPYSLRLCIPPLSTVFFESPQVGVANAL